MRSNYGLIFCFSLFNLSLLIYSNHANLDFFSEWVNVVLTLN